MVKSSTAQETKGNGKETSTKLKSHTSSNTRERKGRRKFYVSNSAGINKSKTRSNNNAQLNSLGPPENKLVIAMQVIKQRVGTWINWN